MDHQCYGRRQYKVLCQNEMMVCGLELIFVGLSLLSSASASFLYGQPCSERNTAYLYPSSWIIPDNNEVNCVDIAQSGEPDVTISGGFFQKVRKADTLYADHMNMTRFPDAIVYALPYLETVDLSTNAIRRLPYKMYRAMPRVEKLLLADNAVFVPKKRALFKSVSVRMLMLSRNGIGHIYPLTFSKMTSLDILYLDGNRLKQVSPEMFYPGLVYLHLGRNAIAEVPPKELMPLTLRYYIIKDQKKIVIK